MLDEHLLLVQVLDRVDPVLEDPARTIKLDQHLGAPGGQENPEQVSENSSSNTSTYNLRNTTSRQLGQKVPIYKYLNTGAVPKWVETAEEVYDTIDRIQDIYTERGFGSLDVPVTNSISESSTHQPASLPPTVVVSSPIADQSLSSSFGVVKLPEGPLLRSPVPLGWSYSDPSTVLKK